MRLKRKLTKVNVNKWPGGFSYLILGFFVLLTLIFYSTNIYAYPWRLYQDESLDKLDEEFLHYFNKDYLETIDDLRLRVNRLEDKYNDLSKESGKLMAYYLDLAKRYGEFVDAHKELLEEFNKLAQFLVQFIEWLQTTPIGPVPVQKLLYEAGLISKEEYLNRLNE